MWAQQAPVIRRLHGPRLPYRLDSLPSSTPGAAGRTPRAWLRYLRNTSVRLRVVPRLPPCGTALMPGTTRGAHASGTAGVRAAAGRAVRVLKARGAS